MLLCRHDHEGAEDAEMGTYTFGNIFSLDKRIKFNVSRLVLCHRKMYESTECLGHGHERCQRQRKIFPVFSRTTHFPWESNKGLLVLAIHLLPRKRGNIIFKTIAIKTCPYQSMSTGAGMLFGQRNLFSLRQTWTNVPSRIPDLSVKAIRIGTRRPASNSRSIARFGFDCDALVCYWKAIRGQFRCGWSNPWQYECHPQTEK